jgi:ribosomal-protein-alanine N-acetyltransferase
VAIGDHKVIGYIMCRIETGFSEIKRWNLIKKGHIVSIAVLPEYRSSGVGYALLVKALEGMGEYRASESFLEVRKSNVAAINLYKKLDFKPVKSINGYYKDGEAAYVMARSIT